MIEDHPTNRKLIGDILCTAGHTVIEAKNADEGISLALSNRPDLIIMDIQLPGTDGLTATRIIKYNNITSDIPILAVTAYAMSGDENRILDAGCDDYLAKPIEYKELLKKVLQLTKKKGHS